MEIINWQEEASKYDEYGQRGSFISWIITTSLGRAETELAKSIGKDQARKKFFEDLNKATNAWTECKVTMQINGMEVPVQQSIDEIEKCLDQYIEDKARELLKKSLSLGKIYDLINKFEWELNNELEQLIAKQKLRG